MALPVKKLRALAMQHKKGGLKFGKPTDEDVKDDDDEENKDKGDEGEEQDENDEGGHKGSPDKRDGGKQQQPQKNKQQDDGDEEQEQSNSDESDDIAIANEVGQEIIENGVEDDIAGLLQDYNPGDNPAWAADEDIWQRAVKAVDPEGDGADKYDEPYAVVAATYKKLGGNIKNDKGGEGDEGGEGSDGEEE